MIKFYYKSVISVISTNKYFFTTKFPQVWGTSLVLGESFHICDFPSTGEISLFPFPSYKKPIKEVHLMEKHGIKAYGGLFFSNEFSQEKVPYCWLL